MYSVTFCRYYMHKITYKIVKGNQTEKFVVPVKLFKRTVKPA